MGHNHYRLLALDMDGTLLDSRKRISPQTTVALRQLVSRGTHVVLSTGRNLAELADYQDELAYLTHASLASGALVYDLGTRRALQTHPLDTPVVLAVLEQGARIGALGHLHTVDGSVVSKDMVACMDRYGMGVYQDLFERVTEQVDDLASYALDHAGEVIKANLYHRTPEERDASLDALSAFPLQLARSERGSLECSPPGVSKVSGLAALCSYLGLSIDQAVVVGDGDNDVEVLRVAGLAVAMGNATPRVRSVCDVMVADNDHDGIVEVVERFF